MATPSAAANAAAMALDAPLAHIRQRLDALVYDDHSQYLLGSLQHADALTTSAQFTQRCTGGGIGGAMTHRTSNLGVSIRRRRIPGNGRWARVVGVTPYYVVFALFIGLGWFFQALGVFAYAFAFPQIIGQELGFVGAIKFATKGQSYIALSFFFLAETVGAIGFGACADHYGRRRVLLAAIALWWLGEALVPVAQGYAALLAFRLVAGLGLGGQSALLITIALEYSPKRTRGRILVLSQLLGGCGIVLAALVGKLVTPWRWGFLVLALASTLFAALYALRLRESPTYLASIGRLEQALAVLQAMESAHGIDRQARVTVPSSLYAPPALQQQRQRQRSSTRIPDARPVATAVSSPSQLLAYQLKEEQELDSDELAPLPRTISRRGTVDYQHTGNYVVPSSGNVGRPRASTDRHAAASPAMVSFTVSSSKRFAVLFQSQYLRKTLFLWALWLFVCGAFGAATTCILRRLEGIDRVSAAAYVYVGGMTLPGLMLSAVLVEQLGRKLALAVFVFCSGVMLMVVGAYMSTSATAASVLVTVGCLALFFAGAFAALCVYTGEHYALMVRAMGIAWALAWGHFGSFLGVHLAISHWALTAHAGHQHMLWIAGGVCFVVFFGVLAFGTETQGVDIDIIEPLKAEPVKRTFGVGDDDDLALSSHHHRPTSHMNEFPESSDKLAVHHMGLHEQLATVPASPGASFSPASSDSSASSSSTFFPNHKTKTWKKQMRAFAAAAAAAVPLRKSAAMRKQSTRSTLQSDSCGDLDQLDAIVTDSEAKAAEYLRHHSQPLYYQHEKPSIGSVLGADGPRRKRTAASDASEPALLDWRPSNPDSDDDDGDGTDEMMRARGGNNAVTDGFDRSDSEADKFSIEVDAFDRYSSLSTPMLEGSPQLSFER